MEWNTKNIGEISLKDSLVQLRPISMADKEGYTKIAYDPEIWKYFVSVINDEADLDRFIDQAITDSNNGTRVVFTIVDKKTGQIAGSTAFGNIAASERRLEIGWSWLGASFRGTGINRSAKQALLTFAFETLRAERVEFKTDQLNERARRGLTSIGAKEEGILRSFNYMPGGRRRDAVYYSILKYEWAIVKARHFRD